MFSSLLRPRNRRRRSDAKSRRYSSSSPAAVRRPLLHGQEQQHQQHSTQEQGRGQGRFDDSYEDDDMSYHNDEDGDEDEDDVDTPLLPIFSSEHLDKLPLYNITHSCRLLIVQKVETTLSWDQLRSPQVSQFVVKPIQSQILDSHCNRATICALIANCLQFQKEAQLHPGNAGVSKTRAMVSELLAMRLLKEFSVRELIDALSYDFDPLEGFVPPGPPGPKKRHHGRGARISAVEIAIRAQAKRFLAHPLVVQQLEAIWAGTIVFHSAADNLHRKPTKAERRRNRSGYGTVEQSSGTTTPAGPGNAPIVRRSVTLYDPRDASLFKLSRLRVPRYRQLFSTLSFAIMLGLFLAVLVDRSLTITPLEVLFWFWSAGYMLDEVVGFSEQGFGLYIMSVWNAFDLGILLLFFIYYFLRIYSVLLEDVRQHTVANMAYDVLASSAIMLFPRLFSVLDHYRYFSQLLIAFRMMAQDMVAILVLIVISCSGFFVAFTLSFSDDKTDGSKVAYALFQLVMGFTPAAWEMWPTYNVLGKGILTIFLFICHFLIVTILITVLTNSFMAIVQNANEEHQFLFAVNTISMVKSDALFSYIPPTNLFGWIATPLRWLMPFRTFVKFNRTIIKGSHFPLLFTIFSYERIFLASNTYEPTDLIERKPRIRGRIRLPAFSLNKNPGPFSPGTRLREPSIVSFRKERALDEVFRRPYHDTTMRTNDRHADDDPDHRRSTNVVGNWMRGVSNEGGASPPMEQPRSVVERLETRRPVHRRAQTANRLSSLRRDHSMATRSVISDPEDTSTVFPRKAPHRIEEETDVELSRDDLPQETDADGDDELVTNDDAEEAENGTVTGYEPTDEPSNHEDDDDKENVVQTARHSPNGDYFGNTVMPRLPGYGALSHATKARLLDAHPRPGVHDRQLSSSTILFIPSLGQPRAPSSSASELQPQRDPRPETSRPTNSGGTGSSTPVNAETSASAHNPDRKAVGRPRPAMPSHALRDLPNIRFNEANISRRQGGSLENRSPRRREPSFNAMALDLASELGDDRYAPDALSPSYHHNLSASFSEQILRERNLVREMERQRVEEERRRQADDEEKNMVGRIMLARMNTLEEGFREVLREVKAMSNAAGGSSSRGDSDISGLPGSRRPGSAGKLLTTLGVGRKVGGARDGKKSPRKEWEGHGARRRGKERARDSGSDDGDEGASSASDRALQAARDAEQEEVSPAMTTIRDLGIPTGGSPNTVSGDEVD